MGSYLTVVNDTEHPWQCKVGPDMQAIKWATIGVAVAAATAAMLVTGGFIAPVVGSFIAGSSILWAPSILFVAGSMVAGAGFIAGSAPTLIGVSVAKAITNTMEQEKYDLIRPGQQKRYGKMSLSLWRQSACIKVSTEKDKVFMETLYMRPIFSGSTANSNRDHSIQWWLNKDGTKREEIRLRAQAPPKRDPPANDTPPKDQQSKDPLAQDLPNQDPPAQDQSKRVLDEVLTQPTSERALEEDTMEYATTE